MGSEPSLPSVGAPSSARLELESHPQTLALVRAVLSGVAEYLSIDPELLDDMRTAVSEACNNVVQHAYPDGSVGTLRLELFLAADAIVALVRDTGIGLDERTLSSDADAGVGIPVIRTLASAVRFRHPDRGGTELSMAFAAERAGQRLVGSPLLVDPSSERVPDPVPSQAGEVSGSVSPNSLLEPVLGRLARTLAAACQFSLDRFSDVYLVTDAVAALMSAGPAAERSWFTVRSAPQRLELLVGPLAEGSVGRLRASAAAHPSALLVLSDEVSAERGPDGYEMLRVMIADSASLG